MTISFNDIVAFVKRAMKENLDVTSCITSDMISVRSNDEKTVVIDRIGRIFDFSDNDDKLYVNIGNNSFDIMITEKEMLQYRLLIKDVEEYSTSKAIYEFNNFFDRDCFKYKDINSLDDEEEED